ncbi:PAS domain S-box protein [Algoriphagus namhaensis]
MHRLRHFDLSVFFDQFKGPLFLMDRDEVIYCNKFCSEHFKPLPEDWRKFFTTPRLIEGMEEFFDTGKEITSKVYQTLETNAGEELSYIWEFICLPSSYDTRFLVAKGDKKQVIPEKPALFIENPEEFSKEEIQYLRTILNNTHDLIAILDLDGNYKFISPSVGEKLGFSVNDIVGRNFRDFLSMGVLELVQGNYQDVLKTKNEVNIDFWLKTKDGRKLYIESFAKNLLDDPYINGVLFSARDITEFIETKESLRRSEEKYRTLVEESTEIIFSLSDTFQLTYVSPNVTQFLGYDSREVIGKSIFDYLSPDDLDVFQEMITEEKDFLEKNQFLEFRLKHKDGSYRVFNSNGKMIHQKDGLEKYYTGIARDISKLKEAQAALLEQKEKAEQASLIKSQFLSIMSHEIRTPLNAVVGMAHFLMEENPREDQLENLRTLQFSAENLTGLINDILDYSKIESGKIELESVPFDLRQLITRLIHSYSFQAHEKNLELQCIIDEDIPDLLLGDSIRLGQIINNLVSNAIKFTDKGEVVLRASAVQIDEEKTEILFECIDSGIGIPEEKKESIFEAFTQASSDTTRKYGGTGLGLAVVKRLIELHGSAIELKNRDAGGTEFSFNLTFQIPKSNEQSMKKDGKNAPKSLEEASILVAEDNMVNQILIQKFLTKWNTGKLVIASDGQEAIDEFEKSDFDLILLDIQMPIKDGFEVAEYIRKHESSEKSSTPILLLTATSIHEINEKMKEIGIDDFVPKPFTPEGLYDKLIGQLQHRD